MEENPVELSISQLTTLYELITTFLVNYSFQIIGAVVVLIFGLFIANKASNWVKAVCLTKKLDVTLSQFIANVAKIVIVAIVVVIVLNKLGINITPMVAAIGALSLGAGLAVQGLLTNYSAGLNIIVTRPYVVGDTISLLGVTGVVKEVNLSHTLLTNEDEELITIPNRHVIGEIIHNSKESRVVELSIGVAYNADIDLAKHVITAALANIEGNDPRPPQVGIDNFGDSSINLSIRFWAPTITYFEQKFKTNQAIFNALADNNIQIPFPQREVTLLNPATSSKENH
ncbi:mechanosensitive ion channel family protein [Sessilibacter corallicola]|uniref:mechanosensitive ion channel family protein n=1 Tax=Sessilibacter corallicola TaxID=2904075 RepID=UPI001E3A4780|nr:mechanosensitive ion channel family protein [Sessilibacter corallicola]MCE2030045.1 mechanosensitive ion channel family protein [Sessilibacter corallicola]